jgi:hypothetical protein
VYDALKYAEKKMYCLYMLRNDAKDIDFAENFPNDSEDKVKEFADVITIGALNFEYGDKVVARFQTSRNVDVLRRSKIYATLQTTNTNTYKVLQWLRLPLELLL